MLCGASQKSPQQRVGDPSLLFLLLTGWDADVMAGAQAHLGPRGGSQVLWVPEPQGGETLGSWNCGGAKKSLTGHQSEREKSRSLFHTTVARFLLLTRLLFRVAKPKLNDTGGF